MTTRNFSPVQTDIGHEKMINSANVGLDWHISHIGIGDANGVGYTPTVEQIALKNELMRVPVVEGNRIENGFRAITHFPFDAVIGQIPIRELAFYAKRDNEAPVLWAVYSDVDLLIDVLDAGKTYIAAYGVVINRGNTDKLVFTPAQAGNETFNLSAIANMSIAQMHNSATIIDGILTEYEVNDGV